MTKKKIALIVDNPKRDLDGLILISWELAQLGHKVFLTPMYFQNCDVPFLEPDYILLNYIRKVNSSLASSYKNQKILTGVLDTEGGVLSKDGIDAPDSLAKFYKKENFHKSIDQYFFWGKEIAGPFNDMGLFTDTNCSVTAGCPRYDFCLPPYKNLLKSPHKNFILINTNFSTVNSKYGTNPIDREAFLATGWDKDYTEHLIEETIAGYERFKKEIQKLFEDLPYVNFVLRPHPFENDQVYKNLFEKFKNVTVDPKGNVLNNLANAKAMIHLNCGSALESILLETPAICLDHINSETLYKQAYLAKDVSLSSSSYENLKEIISLCWESKFDFPFEEKKKLISPWLANTDSLASDIVAKSIDSFILKHRPTATPIPLKNKLMGIRVRSDFPGLINQLTNYLLGSSNLEKLRSFISPKRKEKTLPLNYVNQKLNQIGEIKVNNNSITAKVANRGLGRRQTTIIIERN